MTFCHGLKLIAPDGKMRQTDSANTEGIFRIIQSIPSPKAEPFKRWLAKVGYEVHPHRRGDEMFRMNSLRDGLVADMKSTVD